jgi:glycosyltransferase domain-containing protein
MVVKLKDTCIVIPTHNRHQYLDRCLNYYSEFECKIIVCDSSFVRYTSFIPVNIFYYHMPNKDFAEKVLFAISEAHSKYIALAPDDDFIIEASLKYGREKLQENTDAQACVGEVVMFYERPPFRIVKNPGWCAAIFDKNLAPEIKIANYLSDYKQILWSLYKVNALKICFETIQEANFENQNFFEITIATLCAGSGGIIQLDNIWIARELTENEHWGSKHSSILDIENLMSNADVIKFMNYMNEILFPGAGTIALDAYKITEKHNNYYVKIIKKILNRISRKKYSIKLQAFNIDGDSRFQSMRKSFEHFHAGLT